jgi:conjugative transfer signal peptidase TraF
MAGAFITMKKNSKNGHSIAVVNQHRSIEMTAKQHKIMLAMAALGIAFLAVKPFINPVPLVIWNASESVPIGWYFVGKRQPKIGQIAVIKPVDWVLIYASSRGYLPQDVWLLKPIFAVHPSIICRIGSHVFIDGKQVAKAKSVDKMHRALPVWKGCSALSPTQYFVLGRHRDSFDSRYFGPVEQSQVVGTAFPLTGLFK